MTKRFDHPSAWDVACLLMGATPAIGHVRFLEASSLARRLLNCERKFLVACARRRASAVCAG